MASAQFFLKQAFFNVRVHFWMGNRARTVVICRVIFLSHYAHPYLTRLQNPYSPVLILLTRCRRLSVT